jgi:fatty acid desaturase
MGMLLKARPQVYDLSNGFERSTDLADNDFTIGDKGQWWTSGIDRKTMKALMRRENARPLADYGLWLALLVASGCVAFLSWGTWWAIPAFLAYGTVYSSCDPRSHDLGHGATFRSRRLNDAFLYLTLFMTMKEPVLWRWRHTRHHTDTIHVGRDPEILVTRPADLLRIAADFFFVFQAIGELKPALLHAFGRITPDAGYYVPKSEQPKMVWSSRFLIGSMAGLVVFCAATGNWMPLLFVWGPRFYGNWLNFLGFLTQHAALAEDAYDHRLKRVSG